MLRKVFAVLLGLIPSISFASGPGVQFIDYYELILERLGLSEHQIVDWAPVLGGFLSLAILTIVGLKFRASVARSGVDVVPEERFCLRTFVEMVLDFVHDLARDVIGHDFRPFLSLLFGLFLFIFTSNLTGLVPGFPPATESINTNLAMGLTVFIWYNIAGVREHGPAYIKQFFGPVWWLAPLMFGIEVISHLARPISLSLRLYGNIFGDHLVLSVFTGLSYLVLPAFLLFFGLLVLS